MNKRYREMQALWKRLDRTDQKILIDFMDPIIDDWMTSEWANFFIGIVFGVCILTASLMLMGN